jgi:hypothetical protein
MKLIDLLREVKDEHLTKSQLEDYHTKLSALFGDIQLEMADLKKKKAIFEASDPNDSVAKMKVRWKATPEGQRLIELEGYGRATNTQLRSLKNRLYAMY